MVGSRPHQQEPAIRITSTIWTTQRTTWSGSTYRSLFVTRRNYAKRCCACPINWFRSQIERRCALLADRTYATAFYNHIPITLIIAVKYMYLYSRKQARKAHHNHGNTSGCSGTTGSDRSTHLMDYLDHQRQGHTSRADHWAIGAAPSRWCSDI